MIRDGMAIDVESGQRRRVAESLLGKLHVGLVGNEKAGIEVPQSVESEPTRLGLVLSGGQS